MSSDADANLSDWVSQVQNRHGSGLDTPVKSASDDLLEAEIERSRAERAKRRSQLAGTPSSPSKDNDRGEKDENLDGMPSAYAKASIASTSSSSPPKRGQTLLDRYGGQQGPTGTARAGTSDAPASLASFMGGKASGPRLGKLQGDGRTTPPEARMIDYADHRPLPGMTTNAAGGKSLASFLEARASSQGQGVSGRRSPEKQISSGVPLEARKHLSVETRDSVESSSHRDRATSPLKANQISDAKEVTPSRGAYEKPSTEQASSSKIAESSPAFSSTQSSAVDRMPSASLTRLQSKKMVEQRVREAQERDSGDRNHTPAVKSAPAWITSTPEIAKAAPTSSGTAVKGRWPEVKAIESLASERRTAFTTGHLGNALPGMSNPKTSPTRNLYAVNRNKEFDEDRKEQHFAPIRLPGMGSAESPFATRQAAQQQQEENDTASQPLENLTKGRVKPKRMARGSAGPESVKSVSRERTSLDDRAAKGDSPEISMPLSVDTTMTSSSKRQDSLPDSAERRMADSTAALEALVQGEMISTPIREKERSVYQPDPMPRRGTLKIARNKDSHITIDTSAVLQRASRPQVTKKTVSLEVISIKSDGLKVQLRAEEQKVLYETETQVITYRYRDVTTNALATVIYARAGRLSKLLSSPHSIEAKMIQELGKQYSSEVIDSRQGRESSELAKLLGGVLIAREGSRNTRDEETSCMFEVRGSEGAYFVDQVDMLSSSLCSAHSVIVIMQGDAFIWHGIGSIASNRKVACEYGQQLSHVKGGKLREYEEGQEGDLFWSCFDKEGAFSNAWHHRFRHLLPEIALSPRLYSIQGAGNAKRIIEQIHFSALDVRRDGIHILELPFEYYVLVGPEARSRRKEICSCIDTATTLSRQSAQRRGPEIMTSPIHVVVFPSIVPRELRSAFRYWHDGHLNGKSWQKAALGMNVWERQAALNQLQTEEFPLWQLNDELFLPVGVGLEDVQGIDV